MKAVTAIEAIAAAVILLWVYTAASKLADLENFRKQLTAQNFTIGNLNLLLWSIPLSELLCTGLLLFKKTRMIGFLCSSLLLLLFTLYIVLTLVGYFDRVPCACGGVLKQMGWEAHLYFNLFWLLLTVSGTFLSGSLRRKEVRFKRS
ncbi:MAG: hypothetical protein EOO89_16875 [Pedobacter sp.]|nr:MAG: hypothetical protein EOO89_16875 [Pedobacter sp.]